MKTTWRFFNFVLLSLQMSEKEEILRELVRLRNAAAHGRANDVEPTIDLLYKLVGPTVRKATAARLLGISQTALDRWIDRGEISIWTTPSGRKEIPTTDLLDVIDAVRSVDDAKRPIGVALRHRRETARRRVGADLLPWDRGVDEGHRKAELRSLALHRAIARRLDEQMVSDARRRVERWAKAGRIDLRWADEWRRVLDSPTREIAAAISADDPQAADLRQSSPFAGVLSDAERKAVLEAVDASLR